MSDRADNSAAATAVRPFAVEIPEVEIEALRARTAATRWPEKETVADASQGVPLAVIQELARYWATGYDWRRCQAQLNVLPQFMTEIDGLDIHFIHVRSRHQDALPLIVNHGWPGSVIEQLKIIEAAARTGSTEVAADALERLAERTQAGATDFGLGLEARCRALVSQGQAAGSWYREAIERLGRSGIRTELARAHLLYGEWLRRQNRRVDARAQLRTAHGMLDAMGMAAFAERARRELQATGETVRKRTVEARSTLTAQEAYIARLARDGRTNPEIGAQLFLSARTVEWHLRKVFTKLSIGSRHELKAVLAQLGQDGQPT
jgi:DNA-binding CsgD family transcriptional regulator